jgi:hypothetical protein
LTVSPAGPALRPASGMPSAGTGPTSTAESYEHVTVENMAEALKQFPRYLFILCPGADPCRTAYAKIAFRLWPCPAWGAGKTPGRWVTGQRCLSGSSISIRDTQGKRCARQSDDRSQIFVDYRRIAQASKLRATTAGRSSHRRDHAPLDARCCRGLNRRGVRTASGEQWPAMQIHRGRQRLGLC